MFSEISMSVYCEYGTLSNCNLFKLDLQKQAEKCKKSIIKMIILFRFYNFPVSQ